MTKSPELILQDEELGYWWAVEPYERKGRRKAIWFGRTKAGAEAALERWWDTQ